MTITLILLVLFFAFVTYMFSVYKGLKLYESIIIFLTFLFYLKLFVDYT